MVGRGFVVGFAVPFLFTDVVQLPRDLYYGIYIGAVLVFFGLWARATGQRFDLMVRRRWRWAVVLGVVVAAALSVVVLRTEPATAGPTGVTLSAEVLWRGVAYGAVDGLLLSAFPILAVFAASEGSKLRRRRFGTVAGARRPWSRPCSWRPSTTWAIATSGRPCWPGRWPRT